MSRSHTPGTHLIRIDLAPLSKPRWADYHRDRVDSTGSGRTLRTLDLRMTTAAHFLHHRYTGFNAPVTIAPR
jgi:hypothetical protein